jgi:glycosyltransferase involved in cell wall biosynthesis
MPNVAILCEYSTLSGGERSMLATLPGLRDRGFQMTVFAPPGPSSDAVQRLGVEHEPIGLTSLSGKRLELTDARGALRAALRRRPPDLLHANSLAMGRIAGPVARDLALPSLSHLRDIVGVSKTAACDLNCHARLLAVSNAARRFHLAQGIDADKTHILFNGVDLEQFRLRPSAGYLHRELSLPDDAVLVGSIGQISLRKGFDIFVGACEHLAPRFPAAHFLIAGTRFSAKDESIALDRALHDVAGGSLAGRLHLLGERGDVDRLVNELTVLVHTSRQEPLGRVLLEAAASGLPIVATDVGGTAEIFPPESKGAILVPPDDAQSVATAVADLLSHGDLRRQLGAAARRRAETAFDIRDASAALTRHYDEVLANVSSCVID